MIRVMFVCLGNICRSPLAEGVMKHVVAEAGLADHFHIESSGTGAWHVGEAPDPRSIEVAARHGVDLSMQRAQQFKPLHLERFDEIRAMDLSNLRAIRHHMQAGGALANVGLFLEDAPGDRKEVPDPYYGGPKGFDHVYRMVRAGCEGLLARLSG